MTIHKKVPFLLMLLVWVLAFSGVASAQGGGGVLRVGMNAPINLDPATGSNDPEILFNRTMYDYLIEVGADGSLVSNLATAWEVGEDGLTYRFPLTEGVLFHDGSDFTSADVVYTFNRLKEIGSPAVSLMGEFEVSADGDYAVVFTLPAPNADFIFGVASRHALILSEGDATPGDLEDGVNGTGPFILTEYSPSERAVFVRNENYWIEGQPVLDGVEFIFIDDALTQIDALRSGAVDFIFKVDVDQVFTLESDANIAVLSVPTNQHPVIRLRSDEGSLGEDVRIRQAFKLATNRYELLDTVQEGLGIVGNNDPIGPKYADFFLPQDQAYDAAAACALILEATGEERLSTDFYVVNSFNYESLAVALQQQWAEGCIDVNILLREEGIYYADTEWLEVDLGITGWGDRPVPQGYFVEAYVTGGLYNETHFSDAEVDALVEQAATASNLADRAAIYGQISAIFAERGSIIIPWFASVIGATYSNVEGLRMHPFPGQTDFRTVRVN
jgi:peptide/nickel transport system substrate-binding protein